MMGPKFFETRMGQHFYDGTMPRIAAALERIAAALEEQTKPQPATATPEELESVRADFEKRYSK